MFQETWDFFFPILLVSLKDLDSLLDFFVRAVKIRHLKFHKICNHGRAKTCCRMKQKTLLPHHFYPIFIQKLELDTNVASFLLISSSCLVHFELSFADFSAHCVSLRHLKVFQLISIRVVFYSTAFVVCYCVQRVLNILRFENHEGQTWIVCVTSVFSESANEDRTLMSVSLWSVM
jgi:hypothetical protein